MDTLPSLGSGHDPDGTYPTEDEPCPDAPPVIGGDERRMHVRAYNYWVSLLDGRPYPSITDLIPTDIEDFSANSVLLDFTRGPEEPPALPFLGYNLKLESGVEDEIQSTADVPPGSLLSRLTDHYLEILANRAPIGFEAEFVNRRASTTMYRGILMPFSSNGEAIDFVYGVINWKDVAEPTLTEEINRALHDVLPASGPVWADGPSAEALGHDTGAAILGEAHFTAPIHPDQAGDAPVERRGGAIWSGAGPRPLSILPEATFGGANDDNETAAPDTDASADDRLAAARTLAEEARIAHRRSRDALYRTLGRAYDLALAADAAPDEYAALLAEPGIAAPAGAPMMAIVRLVFGPDYDRTRLSEFALALTRAHRLAIEPGGMRAFLDGHPGGLKGLVAAERLSRRPETATDGSESARALLREAPARALVPFADSAWTYEAEDSAAADATPAEFLLLIARREADGSLGILAPIADPTIIDRALRRVAD
ncbi:MAG TPA: hypothetical protein VNQ31_03575 [Sphingomonadaceae bacterium]|nr:hypothetical protein [Sphingomonadaceae bacterium]